MSSFRIILLLLLLFPSLLTAKSSPEPDAETTVTGVVRDDTGQPLRAVMVRPYSNGRAGRHVLTDKNGNFRITIVSSDDLPSSLLVNKIGYEKEAICVGSISTT